MVLGGCTHKEHSLDPDILFGGMGEYFVFQFCGSIFNHLGGHIGIILVSLWGHFGAVGPPGGPPWPFGALEQLLLRILETFDASWVPWGALGVL